MAEYDKSMPVMPDEPRESENKSQEISTVPVNVTFAQDIVGLEIANHTDDAIIYIDYDGRTASVTTGMPIHSHAYYSIDKKILKSVGISLISDKPNTDVRIIGHYHFESENI